ncbi:Glutamate--cysteine ligase regulatory subunit [Holothuria leucospilota]|uniref:GCS light chain n=1 Tax=Holothuria leucospilota TaxID=206669 RepID=A0A9Q1C5Q7_HOLLE|nr:Glutamate--cysteine ligase regulatory subunit [Holothuria leucospilota]
MDVPRIPEASSLIISSGNIINWECLKARKRIAQSTTEEVKDCLNAVLNSSLKAVNWEKARLEKSLEYSVPKCSPTLANLEESREELKVTVKAMMCNTEPEVIVNAIQKVMTELHTETIDVLLLSVSERPNALETFHMDHLKTLWSVLERMVENNQIKMLGVCDLDKQGLEELYNWAKVKPSINQVNEVSCCIIPPDLNAFTKENKIQLLTHGDNPEILPAEDLQEIIRNSFSDMDAHRWHPSWVMRYTALFRCRGVIARKGYIVNAQRNLDHI